MGINAFKKLTAFLTMALAAVPQTTLAHAGNNDYEVTTTQATGIVTAVVMLFVVFAAVAVFSLVWWILMLVHAVNNDIPDKNTWVIILAVSFVAGLGLIGALVYYFVVKRPFDSKQAVKKPPKKTRS